MNLLDFVFAYYKYTSSCVQLVCKKNHISMVLFRCAADGVAFSTRTVHLVDFFIRFALKKSGKVSAPIRKSYPALSQPRKNRHKAVFIARLMGADPTASRVTGECSTVELQPHFYYYIRQNKFTRLFKNKQNPSRIAGRVLLVC